MPSRTRILIGSPVHWMKIGLTISLKFRDDVASGINVLALKDSSSAGVAKLQWIGIEA